MDHQDIADPEFQEQWKSLMVHNKPKLLSILTELAPQHRMTIRDYKCEIIHEIMKARGWWRRQRAV